MLADPELIGGRVLVQVTEILAPEEKDLNPAIVYTPLIRSQLIAFS